MWNAVSCPTLKAATIPARMSENASGSWDQTRSLHQKEVQMLLISLSAHLPIFLSFFVLNVLALQHVGS